MGVVIARWVLGGGGLEGQGRGQLPGLCGRGFRRGAVDEGEKPDADPTSARGADEEALVTGASGHGVHDALPWADPKYTSRGI